MNAAHSRTARTPANAATIENLKAACSGAARAPADADAINIPKLPAPRLCASPPTHSCRCYRQLQAYPLQGRMCPHRRRY